MRIPYISSTQLESGFEAYCAVRVASLLASDLLKDSHYGYCEAKEGHSFSKLNPKHLQNARELLLAAIAPLAGATFEIRITVQPDLLHKAQGEIDMHFVIRCSGGTDAGKGKAGGDFSCRYASTCFPCARSGFQTCVRRRAA